MIFNINVFNTRHLSDFAKAAFINELKQSHVALKKNKVYIIQINNKISALKLLTPLWGAPGLSSRSSSIFNLHASTVIFINITFPFLHRWYPDLSKLAPSYLVDLLVFYVLSCSDASLLVVPRSCDRWQSLCSQASKTMEWPTWGYQGCRIINNHVINNK